VRDHHVGAAHVSKQAADSRLLRRDGDVDDPALNEIHVSASVDERHYLARTHSFGEHCGENVDLIVIGDGAEDVRVVYILLAHQILVGRIALENDGFVEHLGQRAGTFRVTLD